MLSCQDTVRLIASGKLEEAGRLERAGLRFHLLMCRHCRKFASQLQTIGKAARNAWGPESEDKAALERLERRILETIVKGASKGRSD